MAMPSNLQEPLLQAAKVEQQYCYDDCERRAKAVFQEYGSHPALPGAVAASLADAFEAGYTAAVFDTIMAMRTNGKAGKRT